MLLGLPKFCKKYGNGAFVVADKPLKFGFNTTTVTGSEGKGEQSVRFTSLNRSTWCDLHN